MKPFSVEVNEDGTVTYHYEEFSVTTSKPALVETQPETEHP